MPIYTIVCQNCGEQDVSARIGDAAACMPCPVCERPRQQRFYAPQFTEDRVRFFKGPLGNGYSFALGENMPESRAERDRLAKAKGVEFCSPGELLADNREAANAVEYRKHVDTGGGREATPAPDLSAFVEKPAWAKGLI